MDDIDTAGELRLGDKRPAAPTEDGPLPKQQLASPPKKKKHKLNSGAQSILTEIFALQDTLSDNEIEALARKVNSTRTQVINFFNGWKQSVNLLVDKSKRKTPGFHTKVVQHISPSPPAGPVLPQQQQPHSLSDGFTTSPSTTTAIPAPVTKVETIPTSRIDSERLALQLVSSATTARHNAAATLAPYLDPQGGVKDFQSAVNISKLSQLTVAVGEPTFTGQLQLCDAFLATRLTDANALYLCNNANLATDFQAIVSRSMKGKQITLLIRALHAMAHLGGFKREFLSDRTFQLLINLVTGTVPPRGTYGGGGVESHPAVKQAAMKLLALYPNELMKAAQIEEDNLNSANEVAQQHLEVALLPPQQQESEEPHSEEVVEIKEENGLAAPLVSGDTKQVFSIAAAVALATAEIAEETVGLVE